MQSDDPKKNTFRYVFRKDLGYYTVSIDDPYWDKEKSKCDTGTPLWAKVPQKMAQ